MKHTIIYLLILLIPFFSCEEIPPTVTGAMGNTGSGGSGNVEDQKRQVLIEEFTGVRCIQCPSGSEEIEIQLAAHGEQLIAVSIHAGEFSPPYPQSLYDFRTPEGNALVNYLGQPFGYPSAVVNRKLYDGQFDLQLGKDEWAGYISDEKLLDPKVKIDIQTEFDENSRQLDIEITLYVQETILDPDVHLSVMITENKVKDHQLTPDSSPDTQSDYTHKHVFRAMTTSFDGDLLLQEDLTAGAEITKKYSYNIPGEWKVADCSVIAFVNLEGANKEVLQAHEVHIIE